MSQDELTRAERIRIEALAQAIQSTIVDRCVGVGELLERAEEIEAWLKRAGAEAPERPTPAVPLNQSIARDHLVCLECGSKHQMIKRHLRVTHNLTPAEYRERFNLPGNYPMTAPSYSDRRAELAREHGLGTRPRVKEGTAA